ncbi:MAG: hypothetical protein GEU78_06230 [Actinobacteria bacterium]|nr:hypothetical protein [Actinomycetota bacterium]
MLIALIAGVVAALVARLRGGSLESLAATPFRWPLLLWTSLIAQIAFGAWDPEWLGSTGGLAVILATNVLVAAFLAFNRRLPGMVLAAVGTMLNVLVIAVNGAMPVALGAAQIAGAGVRDLGIKHEILDAETRLPWLGDVIPVPGLRVLISVGDVLLAIGIAWLVYRRTMAGAGEASEPAASG